MTDKRKVGRPAGSTEAVNRQRSINKVLPVALRTVLKAASDGDVSASCVLVEKYGSRYA